MSDVRGACALYYSYQVRGADGRIKVPFRRRTAHSFLTAYITGLYLRMVGAVAQALTDTGGTSRNIHRETEMNAQATSGTDTSGLVVGTGTNAVVITDTKLQTRVAHGTGSGQLQYGASVVNLPSATSTVTQMILTRPFTNASGGTVTVTEIGIYADMGDAVSTTNNRVVCIVRDLSTIALSNGDVLTLNYILQTTV